MHTVESQHRQRLLKSAQQSLTSPQRPLSLEWTIYKLSYSLFSCTFVLLIFMSAHLVSVLLIFFDGAPYYFANHRQNYKFCCISILACLTRKTSQCESALLFIQTGLFQAFRQWRVAQKAERRGKSGTPSLFFSRSLFFAPPQPTIWAKVKFVL